MRVDEALDASLRTWGDYPCFLEVRTGQEPEATTAPQLRQRIEERTTQLRAAGIRRGYFVALFLHNSADFVVTLVSLFKIGAFPVLSKMEYRRIELDEIFANSRPEAVVADSSHMPVLMPFVDGRTVLVTKDGSLSLLQSGAQKTTREDIPADLASINYTYRGYGYPLGAMVTHEQYLHGARVLQDGLQGGKAEKMLVILPMAHIFTLVGCILVPLLYGMSCIIADTMHPRRIFACIHDLRIDHVTSVPEVYSLLARIHDASMDLSALKVFVSGGSLLTKESYQRLKEAFPVDLLHGYGLTEFTPVSRNMRGRARAGTVGPVCNGVECKIDFPDQLGVGEILIKAPRIGAHYYGKPLESHEAQSGEWFKTGDLGRLDDGHLVFVREKKGTRKVNGNIVDLEEVSRAIRLDPEVAEVRVEWVQNELSVAIGMGRKIDFEEKVKKLKVALRDVIAGYKIPRSIGSL